MRNRSIVIVNEVRVEGNERDKNRQVDALKELITETTHMVEPKGVNPYQVKNQFTLFMSTNHDTMGFVKKKDDRRYFVMNCLLHRDEIKEMFPNHFDELIALSEDQDKLNHLRYYFKHKHKISDHFMTTGFYEPLETVAKKNMARASNSQLYNDLEEIFFGKKQTKKQ